MMNFIDIDISWLIDMTHIYIYTGDSRWILVIWLTHDGQDLVTSTDEARLRLLAGEPRRMPTPMSLVPWKWGNMPVRSWLVDA